MMYKIIQIEGTERSAVVYYTVIAGKTQVVEVSEAFSRKKSTSLESLAKSRAAILEQGFIAVRAPTT